MKKRLIKITLNTMIGLAIILSLYIAIFGSIARKNGDVLSLFGYSYSYVPTSSMDGDVKDDSSVFGSFKAGTLLFLKITDFESIKLGDVVVYYDNGILKVHRLIEMNEDSTWIAKGDHPQSTEEDIVSENNYRAKAISKIYLFEPSQSLVIIQFGIISVLVIVLIVVLVFQVLKIAKNYNQEKLKEQEEQNKFELEKLKEQIKKEVEEEITHQHQ